MGTVEPSLAGPKRPQDRIALSKAPEIRHLQPVGRAIRKKSAGGLIEHDDEDIWTFHGI